MEIVLSPIVYRNSLWSFELQKKVIPILVLIFCGYNLQMALTTQKGKYTDWVWATQRSAVTPPWRSRSVPGSMVISLWQSSQRFCSFIRIFGVKNIFLWWFYENNLLKFWKCWILRPKVKLDVKNLEIIIGLYFRFTVQTFSRATVYWV